jgi:hypothetical protein
VGVQASQFRCGRNSQNAVAAPFAGLHNLIFRFAPFLVVRPDRLKGDFRPYKNPDRFWNRTLRNRNLPVFAVLAELPPSGQYRQREGRNGVRHATDYRNHCTNRFGRRTSTYSTNERLVPVDNPLVLGGERLNKTLCVCGWGPPALRIHHAFPSTAATHAGMPEPRNVLDFCSLRNSETLGFVETANSPLFPRERPLR